MYDYSGIWFRIWGSCGILFLLGVFCLTFKKGRKYGCVAIILAISLSLLYFARIANPSVSEYRGAFIETRRNSRIAPPLPVTHEYIFWDGYGNKIVMYLDTFSKKRIFPSDFIGGHTYKVYYDKFTRVILKVDD